MAVAPPIQFIYNTNIDDASDKIVAAGTTAAGTTAALANAINQLKSSEISSTIYRSFNTVPPAANLSLGLTELLKFINILHRGNAPQCFTDAIHDSGSFSNATLGTVPSITKDLHFNHILNKTFGKKKSNLE